MTSKPPDFYMAAFEIYKSDEPLKCWQVKRLPRARRWFQLPGLSVATQQEYLLVRVDPPLQLGGKTLDKVLISSKGRSMFPISEWPVFVYVLESNTEGEYGDAVADREVKVTDWAALFPTEEAAREFM